MKKTYFLFFLLVVFFAALAFKSNAQTLKPGDGVKIILYHVADSISGDYYIQEDGSISLPFLGRIKAAERNVDSLKAEILSKYSELYKNPELTVLPIIRVNVFGEVRIPGFYYVTGIDKLSDILAKAGGTTPDADLADINITRQNKKIEIDGEKAIQNGSKLDDIGLQSGDQIFVTRKWFSGATQTVILSSMGIVASIIIAIIIYHH
jgi:protein involved in polysaccharide export with SLBB domain